MKTVFYSKKPFWYALIASFVFITDIALYLHLKDYSSNSAIAQESKAPVSTTPGLDDTQATKQTVDAMASSAQGLSRSLAISKSPESDLASIKSRAQHLTTMEIQALATRAMDLKTNPDTRFESVFMLIHNNHSSSMLKEIIESPIPEGLTERELDFEHVMRAQAIEGIKSTEILKDILEKTDDSFLVERLHKAQNYLDGRSDSPEAQDKQQLEKILEN